MEKNQSFSVLMSVYDKEKSEWFEESIESVLNNTVLPSEIVIVKDGKLTEQLEAVLEKYSDNPIFKVVGYEETRGLGKALNFGLAHCSNELVARMDSDDICAAERFEKELKVFGKYPEAAIVGANITEFIDSEDNIVSARVVPETPEKIIKYSKIRNPFNHPSVMFKKSEAEKYGGYQDLYRNEDYYLWYRMLKGGCKGYNVQENLVNMRTSEDFYKRRGGFKALKEHKKLIKIMLKDKYINVFQYVYVCLLYFSNAVMPSFLRKFMYKRMCRKTK